MDTIAFDKAIWSSDRLKTTSSSVKIDIIKATQIGRICEINRLLSDARRSRSSLFEL